ncbi:flagellar assembly peptidoglycan hydrolase FlgJ [Legionella tunisiensis]|uniref:flagellar assembly peptidoglycan hydrolase FlgJ n=1 Tax=Legionella tunisiensis TaxID=1034944 RepID=UPI0002F2DA16|nr:flagellar assembly peptidoglycan hydrolase FlgJ [Legionella tunisiensis]
MTIEGIAVTDFQGLQNLKLEAQKDAKQALPEVAKQFEAIFLQSMLKAMRMGQHFLDDTSPFMGKNEQIFQDMLDGQYANNISSGQGLGLANMLAKQLGQSVNMTTANTKTTNVVEQDMLASRVAPLSMTPAKTIAGSADIDDFVKSIWPYARQAANLLGLDPKILMAQAALETGWGQFVAKGSDGSSSNNVFNIKAASNTESEAVKIKTTEYIADTPIKVSASFRKYPSVEHSFNDYVSLIKGSERYEAALANTDNPERYIDELHRAGYATDPGYASKILAIYHGDELQQALERNGFSGID